MVAKTKILSVTRDPVLINLLQRELSSSEYEVINTRHTGLQLRDVLEAEQPAFIILDIVMPTLDGVGSCLQLRQWTQLPILMLSTWGTSNDKVRGLNLCSDSYLTEPFGIDTLKMRIEETLNRSIPVINHTFANVGASKN